MRNAGYLIALHLVFQLTTAALVLGWIYETVNNQYLAEIARANAYEIEGLLAIEQKLGMSVMAEAVRGHANAKTRGRQLILLVDKNGRKIAGNLPRWPAKLPYSVTSREFSLITQEGGKPVTAGVTATSVGKRGRLLVAHVLTERDDLVKTLVLAFAGAILLGVEAGIIVAFILVRNTKRRIAAIADVAAGFRRGNLAERVASSGKGDLFDQLGHSLNQMFDQIGHLMAEMRAITDALAHDLRSPVMRMRVDAERASEADTIKEARPALQRIVGETVGMLRMLSHALEISRAEAGLGRDMFTSIDVAALAADIVEAYEPAALDAGVVIGTSSIGETRVLAHEQLIGQAIVNLLENALKYADGTRRVSVTTKGLADKVLIEVADRGPGIAVEDRERAVRRFSRLDAARTSLGAGLGLSLVQSIARLHGGDLHLNDNDPGLVVTIELRREVDD